MRKLISIFALLLATSAHADYRRFASDYCDGRDSVCLTNLIAGFGTNYFRLVIDGGAWSISNGVVVPSNIELEQAPDSYFSYVGTNTVVIQTRVKRDGWFSNLNASAAANFSGTVYAATLQVGGGVTSTSYRLAAGYGTYGTQRYSSVLAGTNNLATGEYSVVVGGSDNRAEGEASVIVGGQTNRAGDRAFIGGGVNNTASGTASVVIGGWSNAAPGALATVLGGYSNTASGAESLAGGDGSKAGGYASVAYGAQNKATGIYSVAAGGQANTAGGAGSVIVGGSGNSNSTTNGFLGAGSGNFMGEGTSSLLLGGDGNWLDGIYNFIGDGLDNAITNNSEGCSIVAGAYNVIDAGTYSMIVAGTLGTITSGVRSVIVSGGGNIIKRGTACTILSGDSGNISTSSVSSARIIGSVILGGASNTVAGDYSMAGGMRAKATNGSTVVISDNQLSDFGSSASNTFNIRELGGVIFQPTGVVAAAANSAVLTVHGAGGISLDTSAKFWLSTNAYLWNDGGTNLLVTTLSPVSTNIFMLGPKYP